MGKKDKAKDICCNEFSSSHVPIGKPLRVATKARDGNPDHTSQIKKLNRVIGQIEGVQRMIEAGRYCADILVQTRAAASAIRAIEQTILETHIQNCVADALSAPAQSKSNAKIKELLDLLTRF